MVPRLPRARSRAPRLALLAVLLAPLRAAATPLIADLLGDGTIATIALLPVPGASTPRAQVSIQRGGETIRTPWYPAWKVLAGDVDGDGRAELLLALARTDRRDRRVRNRLYVYSWSGAGLEDRFRGSSFPRPFVDAALEAHPVAGGPTRLVLLSLDLPTHGYRRETYRWMHFGFAREDSIPVACPAPFPADPDRTQAPGLLDRCSPTTPERR